MFVTLNWLYEYFKIKIKARRIDLDDKSKKLFFGLQSAVATNLVAVQSTKRSNYQVLNVNVQDYTTASLLSGN